MKLNAGGLSHVVIGRDQEIKTIKTYIKLSQHTVISAPRRYGKTTLANKVLNDLKDDYLIVKVDIFECTTIEELCYHYLNAIYASAGITNFFYKAKNSIFSLLENFTLKAEVEGIKLGYEITKEKDECTLVKKIFEFAQTFANLHNKPMIVFFDEFGDIEKFGQKFIKKIRSYMQTHTDVTYLFAGSQTSVINDIFLNRQNAFFNFASLMHLDTLNKSQSRQFLKQLDIDGTMLTKDACNSIESFSDFHPFYLVKCVIEGYVDAVLNTQDIITKHNIEQAKEKILADNNAYFESTWQKINRKKYKGAIYKSICHQKEIDLSISSSYKSQLLKELKAESILNDQAKPTDPFLCLWLGSHMLF